MFINKNSKTSNSISSTKIITNIIIAISLVAIMLLVYLKNNNFELFATSTTSLLPLPLLTKPTIASTVATTIPLLNNDVIQNSALVNFINRYIVNKNQQHIYTSTMSGRQGKINNLSGQVINLINPSS